MDIMTTMTGEYNLSYYGWIMTTLDWNGDGHDDLIVSEKAWKPAEYVSDPNIISYGKFFVYYGGPDFDSTPEKVIPGQYQGEYLRTSSICNAGDVNGDGIDDLALFRATPYEDGIIAHYDLKLCVFYGSADPDTVADYEIVFPREQWDHSYCDVNRLGDINHDGYDDIGYTMDPADSYSDYHWGIIYGGQSLQDTPYMDVGRRIDFSQFCGLGDVNADGIDDFCMGYAYTQNQVSYKRIVLYFGNTTGAPYDSLVVFDGTGLSIPFAFPAGDVNGDGISDFTACYTGSQYRMYFGSADIDPASYVTMYPSYHGDSAGWGFGYGDMNGDGCDDLLGTSVDWGSGSGSFVWWMGGTPMNGGYDLLYDAPTAAQWYMFGFCLTMGDYNADGYCDAAISAPFDPNGSLPWNGKVFIYAGNRQLNDPTPTTDETHTPNPEKLSLYPNPLQPQQAELNVQFTLMTPLPPSSRGVSNFAIYNVKGQKVKSYIITAEQTKAGEASYDLNDLPAGVYICKFHDGNHFLQHKLTIIR